MKFYRYEIVQYATHDFDGELISPKFPNPKLEINEYNLIKETEKGYWIGSGCLNSTLWKKWILKQSKKRFAYPTKEEALINFIKRTEKRIDILENQILFCKLGLNLAKEKQNKI